MRRRYQMPDSSGAASQRRQAVLCRREIQAVGRPARRTADDAGQPVTAGAGPRPDHPGVRGFGPATLAACPAAGLGARITRSHDLEYIQAAGYIDAHCLKHRLCTVMPILPQVSISCDRVIRLGRLPHPVCGTLSLGAPSTTARHFLGAEQSGHGAIWRVASISTLC